MNESAPTGRDPDGFHPDGAGFDERTLEASGLGSPAGPADGATTLMDDAARSPGATASTILLDAGAAGRATAAEAPGRSAVVGYEILEELGRGGMGVVYKARQTRLNRVVALKMVLAGNHAGSDALARFHAEAQAIASLQHPDIVQIHDVGQADGLPFFSLEYLDGGSLARKVGGKPQPPREVGQVVETLARAIDAAHKKGVVHRDLKPANILMTADGRPKITDFGLAKTLGDDSTRTRTGAIIGTPSYMAPEQARGETRDAGPLADQYALGAILYEMLTGRPPFQGPTTLDTLEMVRTQEPVPPTRLQPKVPRDLETICLKCLQKDPRRRYADCGALADDLRRFLDGAPILARPVPFWERGWRWCRRNPSVSGLAAAIVVLLGSFAATSTVYAANLARAKQAADYAYRGMCKEAARLTGQKSEADEEARFSRKQADLAVAVLADLGARLRGAGASRDSAALLASVGRGLDEMARGLDGSTSRDRRLMAGSHRGVGDAYRALRRPEEARRHYLKAESLLESLIADEPLTTVFKVELARVEFSIGELALVARHDTRAALTAYRLALDLYEIRARRQPRDHDARTAVAETLARLAEASEKAGDAEAAGRYRRDERRWRETSR